MCGWFLVHTQRQNIDVFAAARKCLLLHAEICSSVRTSLRCRTFVEYRTSNISSCFSVTISLLPSSYTRFQLDYTFFFFTYNGTDEKLNLLRKCGSGAGQGSGKVEKRGTSACRTRRNVLEEKERRERVEKTEMDRKEEQKRSEGEIEKKKYYRL